MEEFQTRLYALMESETSLEWCAAMAELYQDMNLAVIAQKDREIGEDGITDLERVCNGIQDEIINRGLVYHMCLGREQSAILAISKTPKDGFIWACPKYFEVKQEDILVYPK